MGLHIPIVYNTSGYEAGKTLKILDGIVDIYLPDARYADNDIAKKYSAAPNYFERMKEVDWKARWNELEELVSKYRGKYGRGSLNHYCNLFYCH